MSVPSLTLNNGVQIPQVGLGVFQVPDVETQENVRSALEVGYRHVDTAAAYYNEAGVGAALAESALDRGDCFVTTKLRNGDQGHDSALAAFEDSRRALGLDVVDLYLIHWPSPAQDKYVETWKAFEKLLADGRVRSIGVSNFLVEHLDRLVEETDVVPAVNQIEVHPTFQQREVQERCRELGIVVEAYSPLGQGGDLEDPVIVEIAEQLGVTPAQVVLRWHVQQGRVVIPKSMSPERQATNIDLFSFELSDEQMDRIDGLEQGEAGRIGADPRTAEFTQYR
jgi:diketogulonate reductase-like aldo/keto reductase